MVSGEARILLISKEVARLSILFTNDDLILNHICLGYGMRLIRQHSDGGQSAVGKKDPVCRNVIS